MEQDEDQDQDQDQGRLPGGRLFRLRRVTWKNTPSNQGCLLLVGPFLRQGSFTSVSLRGPAAIRHPWRGAALAASMPFGPLHETCVQPAPKSRLAVFGLFAYEDQRQIKGKSKDSRLKPVPLGARGVLVGLAAGKLLISIVSIVPTLCVGMHPLTLRVTGVTGLAGSTRCFLVGPALAGKRQVAAPPMLRCNACFPSKLHHSYLHRIFQKCHQCLHPRAAQFA